MYTQCSKCETVFRLSAEVLRAAGGQVRCGRCGELFNALARLAEDSTAFAGGESALELETRADSILESARIARSSPRGGEGAGGIRPAGRRDRATRICGRRPGGCGRRPGSGHRPLDGVHAAPGRTGSDLRRNQDPGSVATATAAATSIGSRAKNAAAEGAVRDACRAGPAARRRRIGPEAPPNRSPNRRPNCRAFVSASAVSTSPTMCAARCWRVWKMTRTLNRRSRCTT